MAPISTLKLGLFALLAAAAVASLPHASASTNCHSTGAWCQGWAQVSTKTGGVLGTDERCFSWRTTNTAPACATVTSNEATWELDPAACITLRYFDTSNGATAPAVPNKVTLDVRLDNTATVIRTFLSAGAEPTNGATSSFCATSDGTSAGSPRSGTYRAVLTAVKDNGPAGVGNYNINSDGTATVGAISTSDKGAIRATIQVASITRSAYPAGSTFAYGPAGDESITVTSTFTQPNGGSPTLSDGIFDSTAHATGQTGAAAGIAGTTLAQSFVADTTFPAASAPYVPNLQLVSTSTLTSLRWSAVATTGNGAGITRLSADVAYASTTFNIDPRIAFDSDGVGTYATADGTDVTKLGSSAGAVTDLFNKGETLYHEWYLFNARDEKLSRAMTFTREDATNTQCANYASLTPTSNKYSKTDTLSTGNTCAAAADTTGSSRHLRTTNTDQDQTSGTVFLVSSLLRFDQDGTGTPDNLVVTCLGAGGCPGALIRLYNRGERVDFEGYLINARGTQYTATGVTWRAADSTNNQANSQTISPSAGKYSGSDFPLTSSERATADTTGDPHSWTATKDGNTATSVTAFGVSSLYYLDAHAELSATLVKDNFPTQNSAEDTAYIISNAQTDTTHGWCHVVGVRKDADIHTTGSAVTWSYIDPTSTTRSSSTTDTATDGWTATHLDLLASTPLGTWSFTCSVAFNGNSGSDAQAFTVSVPAAMATGAFPGDPLRVFAAPVLANPGDNVQFAITESLLDGTARTGNAAGTSLYLYNPSNTAVLTAVTPTEVQSGVYRYSYTLASNAPVGNWLVIVRTTDIATGNPIGASNTLNVRTLALGGNSTADNNTALILNRTLLIQRDLAAHRSASLEVNAMSFHNLGFDGTIFALAWIIALIWCLVHAKAFAAALATEGLFVTILRLSDWVQLGSIFLFVMAIWMEAVLREKLYTRFLEGDGGDRRDPE